MATPTPPTPTLGRTVKGLPRYFMDCGWWRHPRFVGLSTDALFVFQAIVSYSTEHTTDGRIPGDLEDLGIALGIRRGSLGDAIPALIGANVLSREHGRNGATLVVRNWAEHNPTSEEVQAYNQAKSRKGTLGNHKRWHESRGITDPDCEWCTESPSDPPAIPDRSHGESHGMGWDGNHPPHPLRGPTIAERSEVAGAGAPTEEDQAHQTADAAIDHMARCDLHWARSEGQTIRQPDRWLTTARRTRHDAHHTELLSRATQQPTADPVTLAEQLDERCGPLDGGAARAQAAYETDHARLQAEADRAAQATADKARADKVIARLPDDELAQLHTDATARSGHDTGPIHTNAMRLLILEGTPS